MTLKKLTVLLLTGLFPSLWAIAPQPQEISVQNESAQLSEEGIIQISPTSSEQEKYIAEKIASELKNRCKLTYRITQKEETGKSKIVLALNSKTLPAEGFEIRSERAADRGYADIFIDASDNPGIIYGGYAFIELLTVNDSRTTIPLLKLRDWPTVKNRIPHHAWGGWTMVCQPAGIEYSVWFDAYLDWLLRCRLNYVALWMHPGNFNKDIDIKYDKKLFDEIHRRGLKTFVIFNYLFNFEKQGKCISKAEDCQYILDEIGKVIDCGADKLLIMCDDVVDWNRKNNYCHCGKCEYLFNDPAGEQIFMMEKIVKFVKDKKPDLEIMFCPTVYSPPGMNTNGDQVPDPDVYNKKMASAECFKKLKKFYALFRQKDIDQLAKWDLKNDYAFWWNGIRPRNYGYFLEDKTFNMGGIFWGFPDMYWGWGTVNFPPYPDMCIKEDVVKEFSTLPSKTDTLILCTGGTGGCMEYNDGIWGYFSWNPAKFDQEKCRAQILGDIFGRESVQDLEAANDSYQRAFNYVMSARGHEQHDAKTGEEIINKAIPSAQNLLEKYNGTFTVLPPKVRDFYIKSFRKGFEELANAARKINDSQKKLWTNAVDQIKFGTAYVKPLKNDCSVPSDMQSHGVKDLVDCQLSQVSGAEWKMKTPHPGNYTLRISVLTGGERKGLLSYVINGKSKEFKVEAPKAANMTIDIPVENVPAGVKDVTFKFRSLKYCYIYGAVLIYKPETQTERK